MNIVCVSHLSLNLSLYTKRKSKSKLSTDRSKPCFEVIRLTKSVIKPYLKLVNNTDEISNRFTARRRWLDCFLLIEEYEIFHLNWKAGEGFFIFILFFQNKKRLGKNSIWGENPVNLSMIKTHPIKVFEHLIGHVFLILKTFCPASS